MVKNSFIEKTYVILRYTLELPHNNLEIYIFQVSCPEPLTSFKHPKLPISIKISVTILQIVYICMSATSPDQLVNLFFAYLIVVWFNMCTTFS